MKFVIPILISIQLFAEPIIYECKHIGLVAFLDHEEVMAVGPTIGFKIGNGLYGLGTFSGDRAVLSVDSNLSNVMLFIENQKPHKISCKKQKT